MGEAPTGNENGVSLPIGTHGNKKTALKKARGTDAWRETN